MNIDVFIVRSLHALLIYDEPLRYLSCTEESQSLYIPVVLPPYRKQKTLRLCEDRALSEAVAKLLEDRRDKKVVKGPLEGVMDVNEHCIRFRQAASK